MINKAKRPNIILLVLDALRAKNISAYGYQKETSPNLDAFASENIFFKKAFTSSTWTIPTHASFLTGLYLSQHRIESTKADRQFNKDIVTLPAALKECGYQTVAFSQNILFGPEYQLGGFEQYFDTDHLMNSHTILKKIQNVSDNSQGFLRNIARYGRKVIGPRLMLGAMTKWIDTKDDQKPFFMMANIANIHYPWAPPLDIMWKQSGFNIDHIKDQEFVTLNPFHFNSGKKKVTPTHQQMWQSNYDAAIMHVDQAVGRFLEQLKKWKGWSNTIVIITADHGEMLGEHRNIVGHTLTLHDNIIHVPFIVRHPDYSSSREVEGVVQPFDVYPSILEWVNCPADSVPSAQLQRPSLSKAIENASDTDGLAFAEEDYTDSYNILDGLQKVNPAMDLTKYPLQQIAVRSSDYKYVWCDNQPNEFYNMVNDPDEKQNLLNGHDPEELAAMKKLQQALDNWRSNLVLFPPQSVDNSPESNDVVEDRLRSLGYIA